MSSIAPGVPRVGRGVLGMYDLRIMMYDVENNIHSPRKQHLKLSKNKPLVIGEEGSGLVAILFLFIPAAPVSAMYSRLFSH